VRGRRSGGNPELKRCRCTPGRIGARGGRDGAGRWLERPIVSRGGTATEGNERREHGEVVEGTGGEGDEHRGVKAELGEATLGPGGR
jgi:hypothetical protein